jgi:hypothetical protein
LVRGTNIKLLTGSRKKWEEHKPFGVSQYHPVAHRIIFRANERSPKQPQQTTAETIWKIFSFENEKTGTKVDLLKKIIFNFA